MLRFALVGSSVLLRVWSVGRCWLVAGTGLVLVILRLWCYCLHAVVLQLLSGVSYIDYCGYCYLNWLFGYLRLRSVWWVCADVLCWVLIWVGYCLFSLRVCDS